MNPFHDIFYLAKRSQFYLLIINILIFTKNLDAFAISLLPNIFPITFLSLPLNLKKYYMSSDEELFGKRPKQYFEVKEKHSSTFKAACIFMGFLGFIPIFLAVLGFMKYYFPGKPVWFFCANLLLGILMIIGAMKTYRFQKWGLYLFAVALIVNILFHLSLGWEEIDMINGLYFFIGFALVPIIPRWKFFK